jgi:hypothetical protein
MLAQFEHAAGQELRSSVAAWLAEPFVDTSAELRELGIARNGDNIVLDESAPFAKLRKAIAGRATQ